MAAPIHRFGFKTLDGSDVWNFTKFLVDRDGKVLRRYGSMTAPDALTGGIRRLLAAG